MFKQFRTKKKSFIYNRVIRMGFALTFFFQLLNTFHFRIFDMLLVLINFTTAQQIIIL